jgi:hypothetical protein
VPTNYGPIDISNECGVVVVAVVVVVALIFEAIIY